MRGLRLLAASLTFSLAAGSAAQAATPPQTRKAPEFLDFQQFSRLSWLAQVEYIRLLREVLVELDKRDADQAAMPRPDWIERIFDSLACRAFAAENASDPAAPPFCINVGVSRPLDQCKLEELGPIHMHDFDTREVLIPVLGDAAKCPVGEKPCSPIFGFTPEGMTHCVVTNVTRSCAKLSPEDDHSFADAMVSCASQGPDGKAKVGAAGSQKEISCKPLKEFFDSQAALLNQYCSKAKGACGLERDRIASIQEQLNGVIFSLPHDEGDRLQAYLSNSLADSQAKPGEDRDGAACEGGAPAGTQELAPCAPLSVSPTDKEAPARIGHALEQLLFRRARAPHACADIRVDGQGIYRFRDDMLRLESEGSAPVDIPMGNLGLRAATDLLTGTDGPPSEILAAVLPARQLGAGQKKLGASVLLNGQVFQPNYAFDAAGWVSRDGTVIHFTEGAPITTPSGQQIDLVTIQYHGGPKTEAFPLAGPPGVSPLSLPGAPESNQELTHEGRRNAADILDAVRRVPPDSR